MEYTVELRLQGGDRLQPTAERVLRELGEMRNGPGEEEMERLTAALSPLLTALLQHLEAAPGEVTLVMGIEGDATCVRLDLQLESSGSTPPQIPLEQVSPHLPAVEAAFDELEGPDPTTGSPFRLVLTRHPAP